MMLFKQVQSALAFVSFSHTLFALPFAVGAMLAAQGGIPEIGLFALILVAMVLARTAAMSFNRLVDWEIDQRNPRTGQRHRLISKSSAVCLCALSAVGFVATTWFINWVCFLLSPVALALIFFYSLTKRFTHFAQFFLGLALSASPVGAWLAVRPEWAWPPYVLALGVLFWVAGFDLIYASQDAEFDRRERLYSMVVWLGVERALRLAPLLHLAMLVCLVLFGLLMEYQGAYWLGLLGIAVILAVEHSLVRRGLDLARINQAFFLCNAWAGVVFLTALLWEVTR